MSMRELLQPGRSFELLATDEETDEETKLSPVTLVTVDGDAVVFAFRSESEAEAAAAGSIVRKTCYARRAAFQIDREVTLRETNAPYSRQFMTRTAPASFEVVPPEPVERADEAFQPVRSGDGFEVSFTTTMKADTIWG